MTASPQWVAPRAKSPVESTERMPINFDSTDSPRLLVSVRSAEEAQIALAGGAEILDVKDPMKGSLGMAAIEAINEIAGLTPIVNGATPLSVALGEMHEWTASKSIPSLPFGITYTKLGLSGCERQPDWRKAWTDVRENFQQNTRATLNWVAVAYADSAEAQSPAIEQILEAATKTGCAGLLIDTWTKGNRSLLDFISPLALNKIATNCHHAGLFFAVAGKLSHESLKHLTQVPVDVIAIRSAACRHSERTSHLDSIQVNTFRHELKRQFGSAIHNPRPY